jgi:hypothetical protein
VVQKKRKQQPQLEAEVGILASQQYEDGALVGRKVKKHNKLWGKVRSCVNKSPPLNGRRVQIPAASERDQGSNQNDAVR